MPRKTIRRSFLVPVGYVDCDEADCKIEALLPESATISRIAVTRRRGVTLAKISFSVNSQEPVVPRRFLLHPGQLVKDGKVFDTSTWPADWVDRNLDLYDVSGVGSLVDAVGQTWWVFEDKQFPAEVVREKVDLSTLEFESEITAVYHLCMLSLPELMESDRVYYVYLSGFSGPAVKEYVNRNEWESDDTIGVLEYSSRLRRVTLA